MIGKITSQNFKGYLIAKSFRYMEHPSTAKAEVFDTDEIKNIQKTSHGDSIIVYNSRKEKKQICYIIPIETANTNEVITAYTAACQNPNIGISLNYIS